MTKELTQRRMKSGTKVLIFALPFLLILTATAQEKRIKERNVPQFVQRSLKAKFPNSRVKKWKKEDGIYIAQIIQQAPKATNLVSNTSVKASEIKKMEVSFYADGKWLKTISMITEERIPENVKIAFKKSNYKMWEIQNTTQSDYFDGTTIYKLTADNGTQFTGLDQNAFKETREIYICSSGKLINSAKKIQTLADCQ